MVYISIIVVNSLQEVRTFSQALDLKRVQHNIVKSNREKTQLRIHFITKSFILHFTFYGLVKYIVMFTNS